MYTVGFPETTRVIKPKLYILILGWFLIFLEAERGIARKTKMTTTEGQHFIMLVVSESQHCPENVVAVLFGFR
jgi:hypothetical protein